jgi:hypothetical protein
MLKKWRHAVTIAVVLFGGVAFAQVRAAPAPLADCGTSGAACKLQSDCCSGYGCDNSGHCRKSGSLQ